MGLTLNTDGPVDPTLIRATTSVVMRCTDCGEKTKWYDSIETMQYKEKRDASASKVIGWIGGFCFLFGGFFIMGEDLEGTTGLIVGTFVVSAFFFLIGIVA
jgi:hypothetical protein